ncbi:MAG: 5'/3'-nucleotidase SurE [Pseudomonadota bacterium]|nr:5'/3'-nucleotidase SurE [Pseudomonadota bacterium]
MAAKPVILLTNDDGINAPALKLMKKALSNVAEIYIVAPDRDMSGTSQSLTLMNPVHLNWLSDDVVSVQGTPADCVHLALTGLLPKRPDLVVSGINIGPNMGDDTLYSGTLAAAFESIACGTPSLAFSLGTYKPQSYDTAIHYLKYFVKKILKDPIRGNLVLNINIPDIDLSEVKGVSITELGKRKPALPMIPYKSPRGKLCYWIGKPGEPNNVKKTSDFFAIANNYVSVTPLHTDLTAHDMKEAIDGWL